MTYNFDCLRGHLNGFCGVDACGANGCGNARLLLGEGCKRGLARFSGKSLRQLLEERMNGFTERAREQTSFVALVEAAAADQRLIGLECERGR